jgi:arylsulfatase A
MGVVYMLRTILMLGLPAAALVAGSLVSAGEEKPSRPNIVLIFADDLGWGDVGANNPQSKIPTPRIDALAAQGVRFSDAHSSSGVCVPSRFSLMTGLHAFRRRGVGHPEPQYKHYGGNQPTSPLIPEGAPTLPGILKRAGYATSMVGKWHLGFDDLLRRPTEPLGGGPIDRGFDRYFGIPSSLDIGPYVLIENDRIVAQATEHMPAHGSPGWPRAFMGEFWRVDTAAPGFDHRSILPLLTRRAEDELRRLAGDAERRPFFLYYAMPSPHSPLVPSPEFQGRTKLGPFSPYGDYVAQTDADVGRLLDVLDEVGAAANTLVLFSSDNGPLWYPQNSAATGHAAAGPWRGMKGDAWEGGHRVPLVARRPGKIAAGTTSDALVSLTDLVATVAALVGEQTGFTDGVDFSPALYGRTWNRPEETPLVVQSSAGYHVVRSGSWKLVDRLGSGGFSDPRAEPARAGAPTAQLYHLASDPAERHNRAAEVADRAMEMKRRLKELLESLRPDD